MLSPENLQAYIRMAAALTHDVVEAPPFVLFFNPTDDLRFYNYGVPVEAVSRLRGGELASLRAVFTAHERLLRFEFIEEVAPDLASAFAAAGLAEEGRNPLLVCTPNSLRPAPEVLGLAIRRLTPESPQADLAAFISVQGQSFGEEDRVEPTDAQVDDLRRRSGQGSHYFLGLLDGVPVAAGAHTAPLDGFTELVGIATLAEYRRRGIAGALTAAMAQAAFQSGVQVVFMAAADEQAGRVYERVGFQPFATALAYCDAVTG
jgi:ribosomal protein S18 acetylase RimI-like enzyme